MVETVAKFDRVTSKRLGDDLAAALAEFARARGLTVKVMGGRYDVSGATFAPRVEFATGDAARALWDQYAAAAGLLPEHFGQSIPLPIRGKTVPCRIVGIHPSRSKSLEVESPDGKRWLFDAKAARRHFGRPFDWDR